MTAPAHAQEAPDSSQDAPRGMVYLGLGAGGQSRAKFQIPGREKQNQQADNKVTAGLGLRFELPILKYLSVGGMFDLASYQIEGTGRAPGFHLDGWAKGRYPLSLGSTNLEIYAGIPLGLSLAKPNSQASVLKNNLSRGWNMGLLAGAQAFFTPRFGAMLEMGWRRIQLFNGFEASGADVTFLSNQLSLNAGAVVLF